MAYFTRLGPGTFRPSVHVGGAWNTDEQHIAPALGLLVHAVEQDRDRRRDDGLLIGRLSYDILGTVPMDVCEVGVSVLRAGRTIELVEAVLQHGGGAAVRLRAWLMQDHDTDALVASALPSIDPPDAMEQWDPTSVWPGGFIASAEVRRSQREPGRATFWVRPTVPLVEGEEVSTLASAAGVFDIANGMTVRADPRRVAFPNIDLTAHLFAQPGSAWVGFDTTVSFGAGGFGLTSTTLHDLYGPIGTQAQILSVRPLPPA
ncbi:thioesterase family protein [Williamsia sterculiae]|uniref:Thioesterase-like superfamily protein n=1 Tax=Williamsia sterculiae TaxID=1344003 RepID=A0A1N7DLM5_9NOCA|nr:thioesterase family protein [Williamsia sterculiae]SIR76789.1 Thioesterase-like superfamily protein [Williamsia sterculiae]